MEIKAKQLGPRHGDLAMTYNNLGMVYAKVGCGRAGGFEAKARH